LCRLMCARRGMLLQMICRKEMCMAVGKDWG
jgi:hypothetical protein